MPKKFTYTRATEHFNADFDEYEYYGEDFDYEVDDDSLLFALAQIIYEKHFGFCKDARTAKLQILQFIISSDIFEQLCETFEEDLKDYFESEAFEEWDDV